MNQLVFTYTKEDEKINKQILTIKNIWIFKQMLLNRFWLKLIISLWVGLCIPVGIENSHNVVLHDFLAYLLLLVIFILSYLFCTLCYSYGARGNSGFLSISQECINQEGTTVTINDKGLTIISDNYYEFKHGKTYRWENIKTLKLYSSCILCKMKDYYIILLPKRLFANFDEMLSYYDKLKNLKHYS